MRRFSISLLFLLASTFTVAQTSSNLPLIKNSPATAKAADSVVLYADRLDNSGCPVGFFASRQATGQVMSAGDAKQAGPSQGLHLVLNHHTAPSIESIEITVYGVSPKGRVLPAGLPSDDVSKTFELRRMPGSDSLTDADIWMQNVSSLSRVDLISIQYADGTTWHATQNLKCRAVPSNFLLVGK